MERLKNVMKEAMKVLEAYTGNPAVFVIVYKSELEEAKAVILRQGYRYVIANKSYEWNKVMLDIVSEDKNKDVNVLKKEVDAMFKSNRLDVSPAQV